MIAARGLAEVLSAQQRSRSTCERERPAWISGPRLLFLLNIKFDEHYMYVVHVLCVILGFQGRAFPAFPFLVYHYVLHV